MSYYNVLAIFNEFQLAEVESVITLTSLGLMEEEETSQLVKAVDDYKYLIENAKTTRGLIQQVILFLLDPVSITPEGIQTFLSKLEVWLVIIENKKEQRIWAEVLNKHPIVSDEEITAFRSTLLDTLHELNDLRAERKKQKRFDQWKSQDMTWVEAPMQYAEGYDEYETMMEIYGNSFESYFDLVPNTKEMWGTEQPSYELAFESYYCG